MDPLGPGVQPGGVDRPDSQDRAQGRADTEPPDQPPGRARSAHLHPLASRFGDTRRPRSLTEWRDQYGNVAINRAGGSELQ